MNKVFNINLGGVVFTIDDVAFDKLNRYINKLKAHFGSTGDAADIIADIEARMAELLQQKQAGDATIINEQMVDEVIAVMGDVNQMGEEEAKEQREEKRSYTSSSSNTSAGERKLRRNRQDRVLGGVCAGIADYMSIDTSLVRLAFLVAFFVFGTGGLFYIVLWIVIKPAGVNEIPPANTAHTRKRLFRDADDKVISGVCAGIGHYVGLDPVWVRIFFAASFFIFGVGFWIYVALWIALPKAVTAAQKLQMKGDPIDVSGIEREVKNRQQGRSTSEVRGAFNRAGNAFTEIVSAVIKVFGKLIAIVLLLIGLFGIGILAALYSGFGRAGQMNDLLSMAVDQPSVLTAFKFGVLLCVAVPMLMFVVAAFRLLFKLRFRKAPVYSLFSVLSVIGIALLVYAGTEYYNSIESKASNMQHISLPKHDTLYLNASDLEFDGHAFAFHDDHRCTMSMGEEGVFMPYQRLFIKRSNSDSSYIDLKRSSRGSVKSEAVTLAENIHYQVAARDSQVVFDQGIIVRRGEPLKYQQVRMTMYVPVGTVLIVDEAVREMINRNRYRAYENGNTLVMTEKGLKCVNCSEDDENEDVYEDERHYRRHRGNVHIDWDDDGDNDNDSDSSSHHIHIRKSGKGKHGDKEVVDEKVGPISIHIEGDPDNDDK